jgi:hypothetical protein
MDIPTLVTLTFSTAALASSLCAIYLTLGQRQLPKALPPAEKNHRAEHYTAITSMLSDGAMVWQRLIMECDELSESTPDSVLPTGARDTVGDWLMQLREFSHGSRLVIDQSYTLFTAEARRMTAADLELRYPEMERFNREMKSNIVVISDQLKHVKAVLRGAENLGNRPLKITLPKPQSMPHFLRKRKKIAELQARQTAEDYAPGVARA